MYVLYTDIVSLLHSGHRNVIRHLEDCRHDQDVATTIVTRVEILQGRFDFLLKASSKEQFRKAQRLLLISEGQLEELPTLLLDDAALDYFELFGRQKVLKKIGRADLLIASIALARQATLVTRNRRHFASVPNLLLANWAD